MSINMSGRDEDTEYADHEVQGITLDFQVPRDQEDDSDNYEVIKSFEPVYPGSGLDSDELAELVAMKRTIELSLSAVDESGQSQPGEVRVEAELGINQNSSAEILVNAANNAPTAESETVPADPGDTEAELESAAINEPGSLDPFSMSQTTSTEQTITEASPSSATGTSTYETGLVDLRSVFGTGPFLDRTDDVTVFAEIENNGVKCIVELSIYYTLYWSVQEMPEGRASFARP